SGFALFGLFQLREFLEIRMYYLEANDFDLPNSFGTSLFALKISLDIFIFYLLALVFTRGLWIGAIGLRYVSGEIDFEHFKYSHKVKQYLLRRVGSFDDYIQKLEHISSSIFAFTYLLFFIFFSILIYEIEANILYNLLSKIGDGLIAEIFNTVFLISGIIVAFDFLTLGLLKRIKSPIFASIYLVLYTFVGIMTLSFLWRPIWYNFIDQRSTKWIAAFAVPFLILFMVFDFTPFYTVGYKFFPQLEYKKESGRFSSIYYKENARTSLQSEFYDDLRRLEQERGNYEAIEVMSLPSYRIEVPMLEVFVKYTQFIEDFISRQDSTIVLLNKVGLNSPQTFRIANLPLVKQTKSEYDLQYEKRQEVHQQAYDSLLQIDAAQAASLQRTFTANEQLAYRNYLAHLKTIIKQSFSLEVNEQVIPDSSIFLNFHTHPNLGEQGFICTFPLDTTVQLGTNYLTLKRKFYDGSAEAFYERDFSVPFVYVGR
ncbi:MAG: hypothetical protein AAFP82_19720, partial [Bacteroidota bacterium]